jgi:hypothetical protein
MLEIGLNIRAGSFIRQIAHPCGKYTTAGEVLNYDE